MDGAPVRGEVHLVGRNDEGRVRLQVSPEPTPAPVLPGRYDVRARLDPDDGLVDASALVTILEDVEASELAELELELSIVTLTTTMTMDGQLAPDPFAHLVLRGLESSHYSDRSMWRMDEGSHELRVTPGIYRLNYTWCDPTDSGWRHAPPCYEPEFELLEDTPMLSPRQSWLELDGDVEVGLEDTELELDVETAQVSLQLTLDGEPPGENATWMELRPSDGSSAAPLGMNEDGWIEGRVVRGSYEADLYRFGPVPELAHVTEDVHVDVDLHGVELSIVPPGTTLIDGREGGWVS